MKIFKLIEIDIDKERARIARVKYSKRQKAALNKLCDLFEAGDWQGCLNHVNDKKAFGYDKKGEYPEVEHIGMEIQDVLEKLGHWNFFTQKQLLDEAKEQLTKEATSGKVKS